MAWTIPATASVGDSLSVSYWNTNARDNLNFLYNNSWVKLLENTPAGNNVSLASLNNYSAFSHLLLLGCLRGSNAATTDTLNLYFNADNASTNYSYSFLQWDGNAGVSSSSSLNNSTMFGGTIAGGTAPTSTFSVIKILIPNFSNTFSHKEVSFEFGTKKAAGATTDLLFYNSFGFWQSTAAITALVMATSSSSNFATGSYVDLYGLPT